MIYDPERHHRRSTRLREYDYSQPGAYFVTLCSNERKCLFGRIVSTTVELSMAGKIGEEFWLGISGHFPNLELDASVVMPNHVHGIIVITDQGAETARLREPTLGQIIAYYKYQTTKLINLALSTPGRTVWQRNYYDRVIRNQRELQTAREYVTNNPAQWELDEENPDKAEARDRHSRS
ncbi:MAG: transposase [Chloroflexi bacterium]|nr:transposase [Chloroflexota bacterium]